MDTTVDKQRRGDISHQIAKLVDTMVNNPNFIGLRIDFVERETRLPKSRPRPHLKKHGIAQEITK